MATATTTTSEGVITGEVVRENAKSVWIKVNFFKEKINAQGAKVRVVESRIIKRHRAKHNVQVQE